MVKLEQFVLIFSTLIKDLHPYLINVFIVTTVQYYGLSIQVLSIINII